MTKLVTRRLALFFAISMVITTLPIMGTLAIEEGEISLSQFSRFKVENSEGVDITYELSGPGTVKIVEVYSSEIIQNILTIPKHVIDSLTKHEYTVTSIGEYAFKDVAISGGSIRDSVQEKFWKYFATGDIHFSESNEDGITVLISLLIAPVHVLYEKYTTPFDSTQIIMPDSITDIQDYAFYNCDVDKVIIPNNVISVGNYAFKNSKVRRITIGNSVTTIGEEAFNGCSNLSTIVIEKK